MNWAARIAGCPVSALTDFSASINPLGTPASVLKAIIDSTSQLAAYPDPEYPELRSHLARHHAIDPEFILPGNGSAELLTWAGRELAQQKFTYLITPAFSDYQRALTAFGGKILPCPLNLASLAPSAPSAPPAPPAPSALTLLSAKLEDEVARWRILEHNPFLLTLSCLKLPGFPQIPLQS